MNLDDLDKQHWFGGLAYSDEGKCLVRRDGSQVALRAKSLAVFRYLAQSPGIVTSKDELIAAIWADVTVTDDSLTQCIADIRRVLGEHSRDVLRTSPRQGYVLNADPPLDSDAHSGNPLETQPLLRSNGEKVDPATPNRISLHSPLWIRSRHWVLGGLIGLSVLLFLFANQGGPGSVEPVIAAIPPNADERASSLSLHIRPGSVENESEVGQRFMSELRAILTRYRTVRVLEGTDDTEYKLMIDATTNAQAQGTRIVVDIVDTADDAVFASRTFNVTDNKTLRNGAIRTAAFASPAGGALSRHLMNSAIKKPISKLTRAECFAHAYNCTTCAGRVDNISERSQACLANILERDPKDSTAWALKAALHAHQYRFGSAVPEPERSNLQARSHYPKLAVEAANKAESLSDGFDTAVYWGMAQAYGSTCELDKLDNAIKRGLLINPYDPSLLAMFGNWLAYSGRWDEGVALVNKAIEIEPQHNRHWWLFAQAKRHYARGEYQLAYDGFLKAFNEDNWITHVMLAYTLPHLNRLEEARTALQKANQRYPGITLEKVLQFYRVNCFENSYLEKIKPALIKAGLPSRGENSDLNRSKTMPAKLAPVNGTLLDYMDIGEGEPIVFVHGAFADYRAWGFYEVPISEKYRFISYSQRYYGTRRWPEKIKTMTLDDYADDLAAFIEYLDTGPVHVVSWSFGGRVAALMSLKRPDLLKSAIHYEAYPRSMATDDPDLAAMMKADYQCIGDALSKYQAALANADEQTAVELIFELVSGQERGSFKKESAGLQRVFYDNARTLPLVAKFKIESMRLTCQGISQSTVPALLVYGENTYPHMAAMSQKLAECMPNTSLAMIPGVSHIGPIRKVDNLVALISGFVEQNK